MISPNSLLGDYTTCELSDALLKLKVPAGGHIPSIHMLSPAPYSPEGENARLCGPAFTVRMVLAADTTAPALDEGTHFVDLIDEGHVVLIDAPPEAQNAVWGGLMTWGAKARSSPGAIVSGLVRDTREHRAAGFPVFARGTSTVGQKPFTRISAVNGPVVISASPSAELPRGLPDVTVHPGDWLVGDIDGVVCVPKDLVGQAAELAKKGREVDGRCEEDIRKGLGVGTSFKKHRGK